MKGPFKPGIATAGQCCLHCGHPSLILRGCQPQVVLAIAVALISSDGAVCTQLLQLADLLSPSIVTRILCSARSNAANTQDAVPTLNATSKRQFLLSVCMCDHHEFRSNTGARLALLGGIFHEWPCVSGPIHACLKAHGWQNGGCMLPTSILRVLSRLRMRFKQQQSTTRVAAATAAVAPTAITMMTAVDRPPPELLGPAA